MLKINRSRFTLIEMLVVISIIMLLAALITASARKSLDLARSAMCKNNLHQDQLAYSLYGINYNNIMPLAATMKASTNAMDFFTFSWASALAEANYIKKDNGLFQCPVDARAVIDYKGRESYPNTQYAASVGAVSTYGIGAPNGNTSYGGRTGSHGAGDVPLISDFVEKANMDAFMAGKNPVVYQPQKHIFHFEGGKTEASVMSAWCYLNSAAVKSAGRTPFLFDTTTRFKGKAPYSTSTYYYGQACYFTPGVLTMERGWSYSAGNAKFRHPDGTGVSFLDGHVKMIPTPEAFYQMFTDNPDDLSPQKELHYATEKKFNEIYKP